MIQTRKDIRAGISINGTPVLEKLSSRYRTNDRTLINVYKLKCPDCDTPFERPDSSLIVTAKRGLTPKCNSCSKSHVRKPKIEETPISVTGFTNTHPIIGMTHDRFTHP